MDTKILHSIEKLLLSLPKIEEGEKETFLSISGYPNYENVISNLYVFFLQPEKHGFDRLFIDALNECIPDKDISVDDFELERESPSENGRMDILISELATDSEVPAKKIFIENKIYHSLENDLDEYLSSLPNGTNNTGIVLSLKKMDVPKPFYSITHREWISKVEQYLGNYIDSADLKYLALLQDFISHIKSFYSKPANMELISFLYQKGELIDKVFEIHEKGLELISSEIKKAIADSEWEWFRRSNWFIALKGYNKVMFLYFDFEVIFSQHTFNTRLFLRGKKNIEKWNKQDCYKRTEDAAKKIGIELLYDEQNVTDWLKLGEKEYKIGSADEILNFSEFINSIIVNEWNPLIEKLITNFKIDL